MNVTTKYPINSYSLKLNVWKFKNVKRAIEKVFAGLTLAAPALSGLKYQLGLVIFWVWTTCTLVHSVNNKFDLNVDCVK